MRAAVPALIAFLKDKGRHSDRQLLLQVLSSVAHAGPSAATAAPLLEPLAGSRDDAVQRIAR